MKKNELRDAYVPEEWEGLDYLNKYDRRVMGALLYSLAVTSKASDWTLVTSMEKLREHCGIRMETLYESCRKFEMLGFFEWVRGKKRVAGEPSIGATFIFNSELIYNPPSEMPSMKELLMKKFNSGKVKVNAKTKVNAKANTNLKTKANVKAKAKESETISTVTTVSIKEKTNPILKEKANTIVKLEETDTGENAIKEEYQSNECWCNEVKRLLKEKNEPDWRWKDCENYFITNRKRLSPEEFVQSLVTA